MYAIANLVKELDGIDCTTDPIKIRTKSRDRYAVSPLLRQMLKDKRADVLISPASVDEVLRVVRSGSEFRSPSAAAARRITARACRCAAALCST
jgi:hypothetical protein